LLNEEIIILESAGMSLDQHQELKQRTKAFALRIIRMTQALPRNREADVIGRQVLRSATSIAANYRAAGRGRSKAEFTAKLGVVIEETDETVLWLELLAESGIVKPIRLRSLLDEANQLLAVFAASWRTLKQ
jgi:four helix bundle protein